MKKKSSKNNKYGWGVMVKGKLIPVEEWQRQPTDSENDRRRAEIMELAAGMVSGPLSSLDFHEMAMFAINLHATIEAKLAKEKTNEVIEEVLGHPHLKGN